MRLESHSTQQVVDLSGAEVIGTGGQASIYALSGELAAKVYHRPAEWHGAKLLAMLAAPPADPTAGSHVSVAWPLDMLWQHANGHGRLAAGFLMPRIAGARALFEFYNPRSRRQHCPSFHYAYLHRTARNLAAAVTAVHAQGHVVGDLNESNVLARDTALVTLVDTDSFQVRDPRPGGPGGERAVYRCPVGKAEYTPPELLGVRFTDVDRAPEHDRFALAVLLFQILMEGTHPFMGEFTGAGDAPPLEARVRAGHFPHAGLLSPAIGPYRPSRGALPFGAVAPTLRDMFVRAFVDGHRDPSVRPTAQAWSGALREAEAALVTCAANEQHRFGPHLDACPWCERARQLGGRDPFPSRAAAAGRAVSLLGIPAQTPLPAAGAGTPAGVLARIPIPASSGISSGIAAAQRATPARPHGAAAGRRSGSARAAAAGGAAVAQRSAAAAGGGAHVLAAMALVLTLAVLVLGSTIWASLVGTMAAAACLIAARGRSRVATQQVTPVLQLLTIVVWLLLGTKACVTVTMHDEPRRVARVVRLSTAPAARVATTDTMMVASTTTMLADPELVAAGPVASVATASAGAGHTCMVLRYGELRCRGEGSDGVLGAAGLDNPPAPGALVPVLPHERFLSVAGGGKESCAISVEGHLYCWSMAGRRRVASDGLPRLAEWLSGSRTDDDGRLPRATAVAVGGNHACALLPDETARCAGSNAGGQLGDGGLDYSTRGVTVVGGHRFASIAVGYSHSCGLTSDGTAFCWGLNASGQLGTPWTSPSCEGGALCSTTPVQVAGAMRFTRLAASGWHSCGLTTGGKVYCWGLNNYGQLGTPAPADPCSYAGGSSARCSFTPVQVESDLAFTDLAVGTYHSCALARDGGAYCWGSNDDDQLGVSVSEMCRDGSGSRSRCERTPAPVETSARFTSLAAGKSHSCGVTRDDFLICWGLNDEHQVGAGRRIVPIDRAMAALDAARHADVDAARAAEGGSGQPYFDFQVDRPATPARRSCAPTYPDALREEGSPGAALVQFVVRADGRPDPATFKVLKASHPLFTIAVRSALGCMRYNPAEVGGRAVSQLVQQPFTFGAR